MTTRINVTITNEDNDLLESLQLETTEFDQLHDMSEADREIAMAKKLQEHITRRFGEAD